MVKFTTIDIVFIAKRGEKEMEQLPKVNSLRDAVEEVIKNNRKQGYPPNRFISLVSVNNGELAEVCSRLITSKDSLSALYNAFLKHPNLLTLEGFVSYYGKQWGFKEEIVEEAKERSELFDQIANKKRYVLQDINEFH